MKAATAPDTGIQRARGGFYRNAAGVPYVTDPDGTTTKSGKRKGEPKRMPYSSTSNFGLLIENKGSLEKWSERKVVEGIGLDDELAAMCAELAAMPTGADGRTSLADSIVVRAKRAANAWLAADRGTHAHALTEHHDRDEDWSHLVEGGVTLGISADQQAAIVDAWRAMLAEHDLTVLAVEASVVDDAWRTAGTLDRIVRLGRTLRFAKVTGEIVDIPAGSVVVLDIKSGTTRLAHSIQIASYAQSVPYDTEAETRGRWPFVIDQAHALIAHIDIEAGACTLVHVDLEAGREHGGQCVVMAKQWEQRLDVFSVAQIAVSAPQPLEAPAPPVGSGASPSDFHVANGADTAPSPAEQQAVVRMRAAADGELLDDGTFAALERAYEKLDADGRAWIASLTEQAIQAGVSFHAKGHRTERRFAIIRGLVLLANDGLTDDATVRGFLEPIIGDCAQFPSVPVGHLLGSLSAPEATKFAGLIDGRYAISFAPNGKPTLVRAA